MKIEKISGILILISFLTTLYSYFYKSETFIYAGIFAWLAFFVLFKTLLKSKLLVSLFLLTIMVFLFALINGYEVDLQKALTINQYLLTLLIAVGFLRLVTTPKQGKVRHLPQGKASFFKTYLGIHLFGSVINLSSLILVADKFYKKAPLTNLQVLLLTRAFSSDAYWSPFFVAFAAVLTYVPNLSTSTILVSGICLAIISFFITYFEVTSTNKYNLNSFKGYPIHFETLYIPLLLAVLVLFTNNYYPNAKVIILISFFSLILTLLILPLKVGVKKSFRKLNKHIFEELPKMKSELALFLVAGMFGVTISSLMGEFNISLPFTTFNASSASILLLILILLSFVGIHPIISISILGNFLENVNHTLFAMTFLMSWSTAVSTSPFSGLNLTMQARYKLKAIDIFKTNISYALKMYMVCVIMIFLLSNYLGL